MLWQKRAVCNHMWPADVDGRKWTTDRMEEELQQVSTAAFGKPITVAAYREIAIAISRPWVRGAMAFHLDEGVESEKPCFASSSSHASRDSSSTYCQAFCYVNK